MNTALIGGVVGGAIGILGGIVGTYFSIKNTTGIKERAFMIKCCIACWIAIGLFLIRVRLRPGSLIPRGIDDAVCPA